MADPELEALRQQRLKEMQSQYGNSQSPDQAVAAKAAEEDAKNSILAQILDQDARDRLNRIKLTKPERGETVMNLLIQMARTGQICTKMDDKSFVAFLEKFNSQFAKPQMKVNYDRSRCRIDSEEED